METFDAIQKRRSIRQYKQEQIPRKTLLKLMEAARLAPSSSNTQSWGFKIITDPSVKRKLREACYNQDFVEECGVVIACCVDLDQFKLKGERTKELVMIGAVRPSPEMIMRALKGGSDRDYEEERSFINGIINVAIAAEHIVLMATDLGIGSCWVRAFEHKKVTEIVNPPENQVVLCLLTLGYPNEDPPQRPRRSLEEIIFD